MCTLMCGELLFPPKPPAPMMKMANWLVHTSSPPSVFVSTARTRVASQSKSRNCSYDLTPTISKDQSSRLLVHHVHHFTLRVECTWQRKQWLICTCNSPTYRTRVQDEGTGRGYRTRVHSGHYLMLVVGVLAPHTVPHEEPKCVKWEEGQGWEGVVNRKIWLNN